MVLKHAHSKRLALTLVSVICLIILLDQLTKLWILHHLALADTLTVSSWLNFRLTFNQGIAYGWLTQSGRLGQIMLASIACCVVVVAIHFWKKHGQQLGYTITTALISGNALNMWCRIHTAWLLTLSVCTGMVPFCDCRHNCQLWCRAICHLLAAPTS